MFIYLPILCYCIKKIFKIILVILGILRRSGQLYDNFQIDVFPEVILGNNYSVI